MALLVKELCYVSEKVHLSRIIETLPVNLIDDGGHFLNMAACIYSTESHRALQRRMHDIEIKLGRDRSDVNSSKKSRPADIDVYFGLQMHENRVDSGLIPPESFIRPLFHDLLAEMKIDGVDRPDQLQQGIDLQVGNTKVGAVATTISFDAASGGFRHPQKG